MGCAIDNAKFRRLLLLLLPLLLLLLERLEADARRKAVLFGISSSASPPQAKGDEDVAFIRLSMKLILNRVQSTVLS